MRIIKIKGLICLALLVSPAWASAECAVPEGVETVDGALSTEQQMATSQEAVKQYIVDGQSFLECLDAEERAAGDIGEGQKKDYVVRYNEVVNQIRQTAEQYNLQLRAYRDAQESAE